MQHPKQAIAIFRSPIDVLRELCDAASWARALYASDEWG
jgi:hypothetical protein